MFLAVSSLKGPVKIRAKKGESNMKTIELSFFEEELACFEKRAAEILDEQKNEVAIARDLDANIRCAAKVISTMVNAREERSEQFADVYTKFLDDCYEIFRLRHLARSSYLMFSAEKEAIEALMHYQAMLFVFGSQPAPSLDAILELAFGERGEKIFDHPKMTASVAMGMLEAVGEISKGMRSVATHEKPRTPEEHKEMLGMFLKAEAVARRIVSSAERIAPRYEKQIDKFYRPMIQRMEGSMRYLSDTIDRLEDRIDRLENKK